MPACPSPSWVSAGLLFKQSDLTRVERLERMRTQAELATLKAQVDPHFLFNSLNTLGHLIEHDVARAREFCDTLADVYRFVLDSRELDPAKFFRASHQLLVAATAVLRFAPAGKDRLRVELRPAIAGTAGDVLVSQERAAAFKAWLAG